MSAPQERHHEKGVNGKPRELDQSGQIVSLQALQGRCENQKGELESGPGGEDVQKTLGDNESGGWDVECVLKKD